MKKHILSAFAAAFSVCVFTLTAKAEWAKSYDWDDSFDQTWTMDFSGSKKYIMAGGWEIECSILSTENGVTDIFPYYVKTIGTSTLLNFDTVERDLGLTVVKIGGFKQKGTINTLILPKSLRELSNDAFHSAKLTSPVVFTSPDPVTVGTSAFYDSTLPAASITAPGSVLKSSAFSSCHSMANADFSGVVDFGGSAVQCDDTLVGTITISPAVTNIGERAFYKPRNRTIAVSTPRVTQIAESDCIVGANAFSDVGTNLPDFDFIIPCRGRCIAAAQAFNYMIKTQNFIFWGKAPILADNAFSSMSGQTYKSRIVCCPDMDPDGWAAFATPCTAQEKAKSTYPGDDVCIGTYTDVTGKCVFWVCKGDSPYNVDVSDPILEDVSVERTSEGVKVTGMLAQGSGVLTALFGDTVITLLGGAKQTAPYALDVTIPVGEGGAPEDWMGTVQVKATDGDKVSSVVVQDPFYTGAVSLVCEKNASEVRLSSGSFRVSRAVTATSAPLTVYYAVSGSAIAGKNFMALSGEVTIPEGEDSALVQVYPLLDMDTDESTELCLTLQNRGNYLPDAAHGAAVMTIENTSETGWDVYVDSVAPAGGDGSVAAPFNTIHEGLASTPTGHTLYVKGGAGREYVISSDENRLEVTSDKAGITICNWGDERPLVSITNKFNKTALTSFPIHVKAADVTIKGIRFTYSYNSLTELSYGGVSYAMIRFVLQGAMEDCEVVRGPWSNSATDNRYCTGQGGLIQNESPFELRNCSFVSVRSDNLSYQHPVVRMCTSSQARPATFVGCYFTNCTWAVESQSGCQDVVCISNVFVNCESGFAAASDSGNPSDGLFRGAANGIEHLTLAYNVFYNDETMAGKSKTVLQGCRETYNGGILAHHNTIVGWDNFLSRSNIYGNNLTDTQVFDNIFVMNDGGNVYNEAWKYDDGKKQSDVPTSFKSGSFFKNNYVNCTINGGTLKDYSGYDFNTNTTVENNITEGAPVFESLDPASPKFCLMKQSKNPTLVGKNIAWTNDGEYPDYIGAIEPLVAGGLFLLVR